jgi:hypothetical protein
MESSKLLSAKKTTPIISEMYILFIPYNLSYYLLKKSDGDIIYHFNDFRPYRATKMRNLKFQGLHNYGKELHYSHNCGWQIPQGNAVKLRQMALRFVAFFPY